MKRLLALTETCLVERDPASYNIVTVKPFGEVCTPSFKTDSKSMLGIRKVKLLKRFFEIDLKWDTNEPFFISFKM